METKDLMEVAKEALMVLINTSMPILLIALGVGIVISLLQALTQIQENTLTFVPKALAVYGSLVFLSPYIYKQLMFLTQHIADRIVAIQ